MCVNMYMLVQAKLHMMIVETMIIVKTATPREGGAMAHMCMFKHACSASAAVGSYLNTKGEVAKHRNQVMRSHSTYHVSG